MAVSIGIGALLALVLIVIVSIATSGTVEPSNPLDGRHLATFELTSLGTGKVASPWASGHPAVVVFFASWCEPCAAELPMVAHWVSTHDLGRVEVIGVDVSDSTSAGRSFASHAHVMFPVGSDPQSALAANEFALPGLPDTVFVNGSGVVTSAVNGAVTQSQLAADVQQLQ